MKRTSIIYCFVDMAFNKRFYFERIDDLLTWLSYGNYPIEERKKDFQDMLGKYYKVGKIRKNFSKEEIAELGLIFLYYHCSIETCELITSYFPLIGVEK